MSNVYVIGDLHLGHRKLAEIRGFPNTEEHDLTILNRWNETVHKRDVVYLLGDACFGNLNALTRLNGTKKLAMGNHDKNASAYVDIFSQVRAMYQFDGCLLTHIPVHPCQFRRWELNVHGHTHSHSLDDDRYVNVSAEEINLRPVLLRQLIHERRTSRML